MLAILAVVVFVVFYVIDFHDQLHHFLARNEAWELDEVLHALTLVGIAGFVYAVRRLTDLRRAIRKRVEAEEKASMLARHDAMTGLPNRPGFVELVGNRADTLRPGENLVVMIVDLDHFKSVNDLYGHRMGDEALRTVARRLIAIVGNRGDVARLSGDEFGIVLQFDDSETAFRVARRIVHEASEPILLDELSVEVGASIGIAVYDPVETFATDCADCEGGRVNTLLRRADMAMYRAKTEGRGAYHFFDADMDERLRQRIQLEREMRQAIEEGEIVPYFQPIVDLRSAEPVGYEVLARWDHPTRGRLGPDAFVAIAEDTGLIGQLTYKLLDSAVAAASHWPEHIYIAVNLSPRQFTDTLLCERIAAILARHDYPPRRLEIEITETAMLRRLAEAKTTLAALRKLGFRIALDDFGTGYAGLKHLRELQLDTLKIDRSYITHIAEDKGACDLAAAMIRLGAALGLNVTAEGIETEAVRRRLIELGCRQGQGYLFGKPAPAAEQHPAAELAAELKPKVA
ncbi:EAL domain-containing protein [Methyloligella sp. 2.7D]|uniref:putative bifunctional diguanylate cyclase/phosphodiesterase n=1 Tax=unclassified Methyloligella TaxID=2625955 RepID=UPI001ABB0B26|nr:EAL domain-containing protein [Methyloligella sp. GL2]